jgi:hypothetical protein
MKSMSAFEILVAAYFALIPPVLGALFWRRLDRMERGLDELSKAVAGCATREEMAELSRAVGGCATREEMGEFRREMRSELGQLRGEHAALRSDLTQVALAVGARPRASEG